MKKAQIITLSVCAVGGIALLAAALVLFRYVHRFNEASKALDKAKKQLAGHYQEPVFPSSGNVKQEQSNAEDLNRWFDQLEKALSTGNVNSSERSPSQFVGILERARAKLLREAQAAETELPENFAFGFERYAGTGTLPRPDDVPRLTEQLVLVNRVCKILFENRVKSIGLVERAGFEDTPAGGATPATPVPVEAPPPAGRRAVAGRGRASAQQSAAVAPPAAGQPGIIAGDALYGKYRFAFEFNAKESGLIGILNALTVSSSFTVVNLVRLAKDVPVLMPTSGMRTQPGPDAGVLPTGLPEAATLAPVISRLGPNYPVCGLEMEIPMRVRIELDVFKFKGDS